MDFYSLFLYGSLIFLASLAGGLLPMLRPNLSDNQLKRGLSLGAGLLLGMALLHMVPEAALMIPKTFGYWLAAGFILLLVLERFVMVHTCEEHGCSYHHIGLAAFFGLSVHGVIEGLALASTVLTAPDLGPLVFLAIIVHKIPAAFALSALLRLAKKNQRQIVLFNCGLALSGPVGIALASVFFNFEGLQLAAGSLLALSSGTFLYISTCDLLPEVHANTEERIPRLVIFLVGLALCTFAGH